MRVTLKQGEELDFLQSLCEYLEVESEISMEDLRAGVQRTGGSLEHTMYILQTERFLKVFRIDDSIIYLRRGVSIYE